MKSKKIFKITLLVVVLVAVIAGGIYAKKRYLDPRIKLSSANEEVQRLDNKNQLQEWDLIFHTSQSRQCKAVQLATKSIYTHCGLIIKRNGEFYVLEAVQPVKLTRLRNFIARGKDNEYVIKRLKESEKILTPEVKEKMNKISNEWVGKNYDLTFEWSDDKIYCSELIWKIFQRSAGIEVGKIQKLKEFDLTSKEVKEIIQQRYGVK
ncbi:MAG TPA: hypothetical protein DEP28_01900, partial [Bacteroidetes bacterium]|nr:hypothetical protein [Bacteroidota bacterium]